MGSKRKESKFDREMARRRSVVLFLLCFMFIAIILLYSNIYSRGRGHDVVIVNIGTEDTFQKKVTISHHGIESLKNDNSTFIQSGEHLEEGNNNNAQLQINGDDGGVILAVSKGDLEYKHVDDDVELNMEGVENDVEEIQETTTLIEDNKIDQNLLQGDDNLMLEKETVRENVYAGRDLNIQDTQNDSNKLSQTRDQVHSERIENGDPILGNAMGENVDSLSLQHSNNQMKVPTILENGAVRDQIPQSIQEHQRRIELTDVIEDEQIIEQKQTIDKKQTIEEKQVEYNDVNANRAEEEVEFQPAERNGADFPQEGLLENVKTGRNGYVEHQNIAKSRDDDNVYISQGDNEHRVVANGLHGDAMEHSVDEVIQGNDGGVPDQEEEVDRNNYVRDMSNRKDAINDLELAGKTEQNLVDIDPDRREFYDPLVDSEHIERTVVGMEEYNERKAELNELEKRDRSDDKWLTHDEFRDAIEDDPLLGHIHQRDVGEAVNTPEVLPTQLPKWWELLSEEEFRNFVVGLNNEDLDFDNGIPEWFSRSDVVRMEMLSTSEAIDVFTMDHHERLRLIVFDNGKNDKIYDFMTGCKDHCGAQKSVADWYEIFAFHLDRVLELNRSLPTITRVLKVKEGSHVTFDDRFHDGKPRPIIWWDPNIKHGGSFMENQNSMDLSFTDYKNDLKYKCNSPNEQYHPWYECQSKVKNIEWSKLAIFDFLLQIHDRLDRNCCGYDDDEGEYCMINGMHDDCDDVDKQFLVHIMTRKDDRSRLVFIDNAGNRKRSSKHLNFKLLEGITEVPEAPIEVLKSGQLRNKLLQSLSIDRRFWNAITGEEGANKLIDSIEIRAQALLNYIEVNDIKVVPDY
ncbi:uncharacterized protein LOC144444969 [Glandiceps talaboti]